MPLRFRIGTSLFLVVVEYTGSLSKVVKPLMQARHPQDAGWEAERLKAISDRFGFLKKGQRKSQ